MKRAGRIIRNSAVAICVLSAATAVEPALAEGPYVGAGIGVYEWKVFAGYEPVDRLAVEVAYEHEDELLALLFGQHVEAKGIQYSLLGFLPLGRNSFYARVGSLSWDALEGGRKVESGTDLSIGIGCQFGSTDTWRLRIEGERSGDFGNFFTVSAEYRFWSSR
jgi:hypothetical protein